MRTNTKSESVKKRSAIQSIVKTLWFCFVFFIIILAVLSSAMRALTPLASHYKRTITNQIGKIIGQPISIESIETGWNWFEPVIKLNHITIGNKAYHQINMEQFILGVDIFDSVWQGKLQPGLLGVSGVDLSLQQTGDGWKINNLFEYQANFQAADNEALEELFVWFLRQDKFKLNNARLKLLFSNGVVIPLSDLSVYLESRGLHHQLTAKVVTRGTTNSQIKLVGEFDAKGDRWQKFNGEIFLSVKNVVLPQWLNGFMPRQWRVNSGLYSGKTWLTVKNASLISMQSKLTMTNISLANQSTKSQLMFQELLANTAWLKTAKGWEFTSDNLLFRIDGKKHSGNKVMIRHEKNLTHAFLAKFDLKLVNSFYPLFDKDNELLMTLKRIKPRGLLKAINVYVSDNRFKKASFIFDNIKWREAGKIPEIINFSGSVIAEPKQGHLRVSSNNFNIISSEMNQPVLFKHFQGVFNWKKLSHGWRLTGDNVTFSHENFIVSTRFMWDEIEKGLFSYLNLSAEYSADHLEKLKSWVPSSKLKPKLAQWFDTAIIKVTKASGSFRLKGKLAEFPFDKHKGEFKLTNHLSGVDILFAPGWPQAYNVDAELTLNKRLLEVELHNGLFKDIPVNQLNLSIPKLGTDKEVLYAHVRVLADTARGINYLMSSPLAKHLSSLKQMNFQGKSTVDLNLEIPLNPFDDTNLASGTISMDNNNVIFTQWWNIAFKQLSGNLSFNHEGIVASTLNGKLFDMPTQIDVETLSNPVKMTQVRLQGNIAISSLKKIFKLPVLNYIKGIMPYHLSLDVTDRTDDLDNLTIESNLQGVQVMLPSPFTKTLNQKQHFQVKLQFSLKRQILLWIKYTKQLSALLQFVPDENKFRLNKGEFRLGSTQPVLPDSNSLRLIGSLSHFNLSDWMKAVSVEKSTINQQSYWKLFDFIDLSLKKAVIFNQKLNNLTVKLQKNDSQWNATLSGDEISGKIKVDWPKRIAAKLIKLNLSSSAIKSSTFSNYKPSTLPLLNIEIKKLTYDRLPLGHFNLKTSKKNQSLLIDNLSLIGSNYDLQAKGSWQQKKLVNKTQLNGRIMTNDLAHVLKQWKKTAAIGAKKGELDFKLNWSDLPWSLAINKLQGEVNVSLRNGVITHLDKQTEEKIGLGKLFSILSLQTLPRRLVLDFSDLSNKGYSFDSFDGKFEFNDGKVATKNSELDGPVAFVSMQGSLNLSSQQYDLVLRVSPHITASLPVVATIAGGPVAGIAAWVASKIINQGMRKVTAYTYKITGPWDEPIVQQISISH